MTVAVSDHAVVRWLERVEGRDVEALRADISRRLTRCRDAAASLGLDGEYTVVSAGIRIKIKNGVVVTLWPVGGDREAS